MLHCCPVHDAVAPRWRRGRVQGSIAVTQSCPGKQVDLSNPKCEADGCQTSASFGYTGGRCVRCSLHRLSDMVCQAAFTQTPQIRDCSDQCTLHEVVACLCGRGRAVQQDKLQVALLWVLHAPAGR